MNYLDKILAAILDPSKRQSGSTGTGFDLVPGNLPSNSSTASGTSVGASSSLDVISSIIGMAYSIYQDQRNWNNMSPADKENIDYQDNVRRQFYEDYESPDKVLAATAKGFQEQGINKMMLAGSSTPSVSASNAPSGGSQASPDVGAVIGSLIGAIQRSQQIDIESSRADADNSLTRARAEAQNIENRYKDEYLSTQIGLMKENIKQVSVNVRKITADASYSEYMALYAPRYFDATITQSETASEVNRSVASLNESRKREVDELIMNHRKERELIDANISKIHSEIALLAEQTNLTHQEIEESKARVSKLNAEVEKLGKEIGLSELDIKYYIWNHPRSNTLPFGFKWNRSSENGRNGMSISGLSDEEILTAARARGLIEP